MKNLVYIQPLGEYFQNPDLKLDLHERSINNNELPIKLFDQNNIRLSRKQILPYLEKFLENFPE